MILKSKPKEIFTHWIELNYTFFLTINYIFKYLTIYIFVKLVNTHCIPNTIYNNILNPNVTWFLSLKSIHIYPYFMLYILISYWTFIWHANFYSISWFAVMMNISLLYSSCISLSVSSFFIQFIKQRLLFTIFLNKLVSVCQFTHLKFEAHLPYIT